MSWVTHQQRVLLLAGLVAAAVLFLFEVLATVFFAITLAYILTPLYTRLRRAGLSGRKSAGIVTVIAYGGVTILFTPIGYVLYRQRSRILEFLSSLPDEFTLDIGEISYTIVTGEVINWIGRWVTQAATNVLASLPVLAAKTVVFGCIIFGLLLYRASIRDMVFSALPEPYHGIVTAFNQRTSRTLTALYVTQALTALATFLIAAPVFWLLGYSVPVSLAVLAGILQFLPVVGPSILVIGLAIFEMATGDINTAITVFVLGIFLIGFIPDAAIRPHLAQETADLPVSLYFVGFVGGILTLGPIGVIAGPLVVALLVESIELLSTDVSGPDPVKPI